MLFPPGPDLQKLENELDDNRISRFHIALERLKIDLLFRSKASDGLQSSNFSAPMCFWSDRQLSADLLESLSSFAVAVASVTSHRGPLPSAVSLGGLPHPLNESFLSIFYGHFQIFMFTGHRLPQIGCGGDDHFANCPFSFIKNKSALRA